MDEIFNAGMSSRRGTARSSKPYPVSSRHTHGLSWYISESGRALSILSGLMPES